jgi:hypothetical protein
VRVVASSSSLTIVQKLAEQPPISFEFEDVALTTEKIRGLFRSFVVVAAAH